MEIKAVIDKTNDYKESVDPCPRTCMAFTLTMYRVVAFQSGRPYLHGLEKDSGQDTPSALHGAERAARSKLQPAVTVLSVGCADR